MSYTGNLEWQCGRVEYAQIPLPCALGLSSRGRRDWNHPGTLLSVQEKGGVILDP